MIRTNPIQPRACELLFADALERAATSQGKRAATFEELSRATEADPKGSQVVLWQWLKARAGLSAVEDASVPLYHLLVGRWKAETRDAFEEGDNVVSFAQLDERVRSRAVQWSQLGVGPRKLVALGGAFGLEFVCDLLAVFRLGACATWIPPLGQPFEEAALLATKPDYVCEVDMCSARVVPKAVVAERVFALGTSTQPCTPADYDAKSPCLLVVSALDGDSVDPKLAPPIALTAADLLESLVRDAMVIWGLRQGDWISAPGLNDRRHQPYLVLAALVSGSGYHFVRPEELTRGLLRKKAYRAFGLSAAVRDILLDAELPVDTVRWFRVMEEPMDLRAWLKWSELVGVDKERCAIALDPGLGGVVLLGVLDGKDPERPRQIPEPELVHPVLGVAWQCKPLPAAAPNGGVGLLTFKHPRVAAPHLLVRQTRRGLEFLHVLPARRCGQVFPGGITCAAVLGLPGVLGATTVSVPLSSEADGMSFGLLVFVAPRVGSWSEARREAVREIVVRHLEQVLHTDLLPDFVEIYPSLPVLSKDGNADAAWVAGQRWSQGLQRRSLLRLFHTFAAVGLREG